MKKLILNLALILTVSLGAAAQSKSDIKANQFEKEIKAKDIQLLDVRRPAEYAEGHIESATLIDWEQKEQFAEHAKHLDKSKPVYVYCRSGKRSSAAADYLSEQGFKKVVNLEGGILSWKEAGRQIETGEGKPASVAQH